MAGDPFGLLLRQRIVFLGGEVEDFGADALVSEAVAVAGAVAEAAAVPVRLALWHGLVGGLLGVCGGGPSEGQGVVIVCGSCGVQVV